MWSLIALVITVAAVTATPRERRQASDECFWWEPGCTTPIDPAKETTGNPSGPVPVENTNPVERVVEGGNYAICNNGEGSCVPYYLCREGDIVTDGAGLIDIRFGGNTTVTRSSSECPQFLDVCCNNPQTVVPPTPIPYTSDCGRRNPQGVNARILGFKDNQAQFGEFPWMIAVLRQEEVVVDKPVNLYVCGGSLIHPSVVLTAAHCVASWDAGVLKVRAGEWDTQRTYELFPHQDRNVAKVVVHQGYKSGPLFNDFALLFLDQPFELAPNVDTLCLPNQDQNLLGVECWATGWGKDRFGKEGEFQNVLKKIKLGLTPNDKCQAALRTTRLGKFFVLDKSFACAGGEAGLDTCKGDGGSPLMCQVSPNKYVQAGIVAWGIGCGEGGIPGVYANVPYASKWIKDTSNSILSQLKVTVGNYWDYIPS
uniref:Serine proteinase-like 2b n=1 Tax=Pacifastacus leniusculus TaxID=6720 RepID=B2CW98_PACLE|nr:serine proteinase-like 2b [Pacifastacus leniusculus]